MHYLAISYCEFTADRLLQITKESRNVKKRVLWEFRCAINCSKHVKCFEQLPVQLNVRQFKVINYLCVICKCIDYFQTIIDILRKPTLNHIELELNFSNVGIGNEISEIADIVSTHNIARLNLSGTSIDDDGVRCLAELEDSSLQELVLSNNNIGNGGVQALARALHMQRMVLMFLDLSGNAAIGKVGIIELMEALAKFQYGNYKDVPYSQQSSFFSTNEGVVILPENVREYTEQSQYKVRKLRFC